MRPEHRAAQQALYNVERQLTEWLTGRFLINEYTFGVVH